MARAGQSVRVTLIDVAAPHEPYMWSMRLHDEGIVCTIGAAPIADLHLPRARYVDLARLQCTIAFLPDVTYLRNTSPMTICAVDGEPFDECTIDWGKHALTLGAHTFELTLSEDATEP
jgi:hypothetical protein